MRTFLKTMIGGVAALLSAAAAAQTVTLNVASFPDLDRGIKLAIAKTSSLLDALHPRRERLYGYDTLDVGIQAQADGTVRVSFTERETLPTAEEIEARYDHAAHPNALVTD